jgi:hypothetical protein
MLLAVGVGCAPSKVQPPDVAKPVVIPVPVAGPAPIEDAGPRESVVLAVYESGASMGRDALFARDASPENALRRCWGTRGHVVIRARVTDTHLSPGDVVEQHGLADADVKCIRDALATVPLRGGMSTEQVIYVRLP